ncbi:MAG: hypothetical protein EOP45_00400 [Sphingobacteriaceae bacterium]|nr:MAG: hypothetical protein EOP45_00400 [Sphingobacteriaceae bacterium]
MVTGSLCAGVKGSKYGKPRKINPFKTMVQLTQLQIDVLVGTMLGDATMERAQINHSPRLRFEQTFPMHAAYLTNLYIIFMGLVGKHPTVVTREPDSRTGSIYSTIRFSTLAFPCLNYYFDLFHFMGKKVVPSNIVSLLTPQALAYWIMDDGEKGSYGEMILHTRSFTFADVQRLQDALAINFSLRTRLIEKTPGQWVIVIPIKQSMPLKDIVSPYMCRSMLYKL